MLVLGDHRKELKQNTKMNKDTWAGQARKGLIYFPKKCRLDFAGC